MKRMLKIFASLTLIGTIASGCILLNTIGLNPGHVKGDEAKEIIRDKIQLNLIIALLAASISPVFAPAAAYEIVTPDLTGIDEGAYYKRSEVEDCGNSIFITQFLVDIYVGPFVCDLQPDNALIDP